MALSAKYQQYLSRPGEGLLAGNASLNYVTTTTSIAQPAAILKHLETQNQIVEKRSEKFLNVIDGANSLCVETETTLRFLMGGGVYLPGIEDNFLSDRVVTLPITHIVIFNEESKIQQIRISWDQGSLLKAVETIGARGRNWPIRDGKDQIKIIASSSDAAPSVAVDERLGRRNSRGVDQHSSLNLFAPQEPKPRQESPLKHNVAPRASAKPAPREWTELFAAGSTDPALASPERSPSPSKRNRGNSNPLKAGAGKNHQASRLHDEEAAAPTTGIKTNPNKYSHFDFGNGEAAAAKANKPNNKHLSQWGFEDFATPQKPKSKNFNQQQSSFSIDDEAAVKEAEKPLEFRPHVPHPRPDAGAHFSFDDSTPIADRKRPDTASSGRSSLYEDHVMNYNDTNHNETKMPLRNITNANTKTHNKNLASHWELSDASPESKDRMATNENKSDIASARNKPEARGRARNNMEANWSLYDSSPVQQTGIKIYGDGMGMRKTTGEKQWWEFDS